MRRAGQPPAHRLVRHDARRPAAGITDDEPPVDAGIYLIKDGKPI